MAGMSTQWLVSGVATGPGKCSKTLVARQGRRDFDAGKIRLVRNRSNGRKYGIEGRRWPTWISPRAPRPRLSVALA